jgi:mannosyl-glycoprotein endo-beta-N-acetylglucosaminidase
VLLDEVVNGNVPTGRLTTTPDFPLSITVPPYVSFWHPDYLLKWNPANDTSSDFNRSNVPLATRTSNAALNVNPNAHLNEGKVTMLTAFGATSYMPSQGSAVEHFDAYTGWQYTDRMVYWGGSSGEGVIIAPAAPVTDAAHRNGVPVLGTIFFAPGVYGGQFSWVQTFLQKSGTTFPVADKLIQVARYYGFDGWFINQETGGANSTDAANMRDFLIYFRAQAPDLQIMWYDAMNENGGVGWQNAFNSNDDMYMSYNSQPVAKSMFLNFSWSSGGLSNSRNLAQSLGVDPYSIAAGVDVESADSGTNVDWESIFPTGQPHRLSLGFYGTQSIFRNTGNPADFQASEQRFWVGANGDPGNTAPNGSWKGLAHYIPASTPLQKLPFVTNFNRGQGERFVVEGTTLMTTGWNNLSLQDVLPTWRWIVNSTGASKLVPSLELDDAYSGGTSLKVAGTLNGTNDLELYQASLPVTSATSFRLVYKSSQGTGPTSMQVALSFEDSPQSFTYLDVGSAPATGWRTKIFDLSPYAGRKIAVIGLRFAAASAVSNYQMRIGRIAIYDGAVTPPAAPANLRVTQQDSQDADTLALRLKWDASTTPGIYYYQVIQRFPDGSRKFLGGTTGNAFYLPAVRRQGGEGALNLQVQAVGADFGMSTLATVSATLPVRPDLSYRITGVVIGTPGSYANNGNTAAKTYDGSTSTFFDAPDDSAWSGLDFGNGRSKRITALRFYPRSGWAYRMTGGVFEAANQADFSDAVTLFTVASDPVDNAYTLIPVTRTELYRYFRYRNSTGHGNVSEIQVYGYESPLPPTGIAASLSGNGAALTWNGALYAGSYRIERSLFSSGPFTSIGDFTGTAATDTSVPAGQVPYYRVSTINPVGISAASAAIQAVPATPAYAWQLDTFGAETDPAITGMTADPDGDGIPNLLEYAFGTDPLTQNAVALNPQLLDSGWISITYPQNAAATDVTLRAQWSDDLQTWNDTDVTYEVISPDGQPLIMRASVVPGAVQRFIRLAATGS